MVPATVLTSARYLCPKTTTSISHFLWRDFYPVFERHASRLAGQFCEYMKSLGMNPFDWDSKGDPFVDPTAAEAFRQLYRPIRDDLAGRGVKTVVRRNSLGLLIYNALSDVPLIFAGPAKWDGLLDIPISGRLFTMTVWKNRGAPRLRAQRGFVPGEGPSLHVFTGDPSPAHWTPALECCRNYDASLDEILEPGKERSADLISNVVHRALDHLRRRKRATTLAAPST